MEARNSTGRAKTQISDRTSTSTRSWVVGTVASVEYKLSATCRDTLGVIIIVLHSFTFRLSPWFLVQLLVLVLVYQGRDRLL
jgi:hypothetical protein